MAYYAFYAMMTIALTCDVKSQTTLGDVSDRDVMLQTLLDKVMDLEMQLKQVRNFKLIRIIL